MANKIKYSSFKIDEYRNKILENSAHVDNIFENIKKIAENIKTENNEANISNICDSLNEYMGKLTKLTYIYEEIADSMKCMSEEFEAVIDEHSKTVYYGNSDSTMIAD